MRGSTSNHWCSRAGFPEDPVNRPTQVQRREQGQGRENGIRSRSRPDRTSAHLLSDGRRTPDRILRRRQDRRRSRQRVLPSASGPWRGS
jgi:hypothetical protein